VKAIIRQCAPTPVLVALVATAAVALVPLGALGPTAATADARTTVVGEQLSFPYQRWANIHKLNRMPAPRETVEVEEVADGCSACTWFRDPAVVRIRLPRPGVREAWLHELGHRFDWVEMSGWDRARFVRLMQTGRLRGATEPVDIFDPAWYDDTLGHHSPHEVFADAYKACGGSRMMRLRPRGPRRRVIRWSFLSPQGFGERSVVRSCKLVRVAYRG